MSKILSFTTVNKRDNNEDSCLAYTINIYGENFTVLLLSDGMGGHDYGEVISNTVISNVSMIINNHLLRNSIYPNISDKKELNLQNVLFDALQRTNHKIVQLIKTNKWKGGGATVVAAIIHKDNYCWGTLGDSRLYHFDFKQKKLKQLGFDHNVPGILLNEGAITKEIAKHHAQRNQLVYFMGVEKFPERKNLNFLGEGKLVKDDILFLCSDGLTGKIDENFLKEALSCYNEKTEIASIVKILAIENQKNGEKDNQTAIVFVNTGQQLAEIVEVPANEFEKEIQKELEKSVINKLIEIEKAEEIDLETWETELKTIKDSGFKNPDIEALISAVELKIERIKQRFAEKKKEIEEEERRSKSEVKEDEIPLEVVKKEEEKIDDEETTSIKTTKDTEVTEKSEKETSEKPTWKDKLKNRFK